MTPFLSPFGKKTIPITDLLEKEGDKVRTVFLIGKEKAANEEEEGSILSRILPIYISVDPAQ